MTKYARRSASKPGKAARQGAVAITVRLPHEDYEHLRGLADARGVSLNCLAAEALAQYRVAEQRQELLKEIDAFRAQLKPAAEGEEDSTTMLRRLRLERVNHLCGEDGPDES